jgi:Tol biopolymer transport system component
MTANSGPAFSVSQNGVLIHTSGAAQRSQLTWVDRTGRVMDTLGPPAEYRGVSVSPDGRRLAVARRDTSDSESQVSIVALDRNTVVRVTRAEARSEYPIWSPDGGRLVYVANETELHAVDVTTLKDETVLPTPDAKRPLDWSPDGRLLLYSTQRADGGAGLHALQVAGDRKPDALGRASFNETDARFSPDGRWIAYVSDETGTDEVYVRQFPEPGGQWPVTSGGGTRPRWRRDGRELYFMLPGGVIGSADIASGPSLAVGTPRPLFAIGSASDYEPFSDGHRFIVTRPARDTARDAIVAVLNWRSGLRSGSTIR